MADVKHTAEQVIEAIKGSSGIKATIMRRLDVHRHTVDNYLNRYATAQAAYEAEIEMVGDLAESVIIKAIRNEDVDTAKWYAKAKLKHRGYSDKNELEVSGKDGGPIEHRDVTDFTDEELARIASGRSGGTATS